MDQEERDGHMAALKSNPLFLELHEFITLMALKYENADKVDLTNLGVGGVLAREKGLGMKQAFNGMVDFIKFDLPKETKTLDTVKHELKERQ